jgi:hypothetical protein
MESGFEYTELDLSADWSQFTKYRAFVFASRNLSGLINKNQKMRIHKPADI